MNLLQLLIELRFNSIGEIDNGKAIFDGEKCYTVDDFLRMTDETCFGIGDVVLRNGQIVEAETGIALYEVLPGNWDCNGKFWPY